MNRLRNSRALASIVLGWFVLFVGVSLASSALRPEAVQLVCSGVGGMKLIAADQGAPDAQHPVSVDCPLCLSVTPPPPSSAGAPLKVSPLAFALHPVAAAHIASATAPPLPSRGPPILTL